MFGSFKHFTENEIRFTENQFPCLVCGSFYGKYEMPYKFSTCMPKQTYNSTKLIIHFNIKNNHPLQHKK